MLVLFKPCYCYTASQAWEGRHRGEPGGGDGTDREDLSLFREFKSMNRPTPNAPYPFVRRSRLTVKVLGLALAAGLAFAACEAEDRVEVAIRDASRKLAALTPASTPPPGPQNAATQLESIVRSLGNLSGARPAQQAAAQLLISRANVGLGLIPATDAAAIERERSALIATLTSSLNQWVSLKAHEQAMLAFDPRTEIADLDRQIAELNRQVVQERNAKQALEQRLADLRQASAAALNHARAERLKQSQIEQQVATVSAVEGAELMRKALEHRRAADGHEAQAADIDAQAASLAPEIPAAQLMIDRLLGQITLFEEGKSQVNRRASLNQERAAAANRDAQNIANVIAELTTQIRGLHPGDLAAKYDDAERYFRAAVTAAERASSVSRQESAAAKGEALHALGGMLAGKSNGLAGVAAVFAQLGETSPALPQASQYAAAAEEYRTFAADARRQAAEALKGAIEAFRSANLSGEAGASIDRLTRRILTAIEKLAPEDADFIQQERERLGPGGGGGMGN